jgi:hypothetical protein
VPAAAAVTVFAPAIYWAVVAAEIAAAGSLTWLAAAVADLAAVAVAIGPAVQPPDHRALVEVPMALVLPSAALLQDWVALCIRLLIISDRTA